MKIRIITHDVEIVVNGKEGKSPPELFSGRLLPDAPWNSVVGTSPSVILGSTQQVRRLLDEGMDVNAPAWGPKSHSETPLHLAAQGGHIKVMDELLERGANIDARTKGACGWTPLHSAAKQRNKEAVKFLIENGAFLPRDIFDHRFNPPLHYCSGLEWAYEVKRQQDVGFTSSETSCSSEN